MNAGHFYHLFRIDGVDPRLIMAGSVRSDRNDTIRRLFRNRKNRQWFENIVVSARASRPGSTTLGSFRSMSRAWGAWGYRMVTDKGCDGELSDAVFFMFGTNMGSTVAEVLAMYRRRVGMEQLISSLKRITGIKHICVWNQDFVDGAMILALLGEAAISVARHCMAVTRKVRTNYLGVEVIRVVKPSTESMVRSLSYSTLTRYRGERVR